MRRISAPRSGVTSAYGDVPGAGMLSARAGAVGSPSAAATGGTNMRRSRVRSWARFSSGTITTSRAAGALSSRRAAAYAAAGGDRPYATTGPAAAAASRSPSVALAG